MKKISSLEDLQKAVENRKAVYCLNPGILDKPKPAAVVINWQGKMLIKLFRLGIYVYEKNLQQ